MNDTFPDQDEVGEVLADTRDTGEGGVVVALNSENGQFTLAPGGKELLPNLTPVSRLQKEGFASI
ncbi:MAG TPA: hypothetical protein DCP28_35085 [Cytophagales bacterium]|nr:hypothetical protein [Cytophagales bacterium]